MKKIISILLSCIIAFSFTACGGAKGENTENPPAGNMDYVNTEHTPEPVDASAPLHKQLLQQAEIDINIAGHYSDLGAVYQAEALYAYSQGAVSSLRLAVDYILWLKGEGQSLAYVIGNAPYKTWTEISEAAMMSPMPFYFEGLINQVQGKTETAQQLYEIAENNPYYQKQDFYYLRNESVDSLYEIRDEILPVERELARLYTPRTEFIKEGRTGLEYSPDFHLSLAAYLNSEGYNEMAFQSALNALMVLPQSPRLYSSAAYYAAAAGEVEYIARIISQGLWVAPEDGGINYFAAMLSAATGDSAAAKNYIDTAIKNADGDLLIRCKELKTQIGG